MYPETIKKQNVKYDLIKEYSNYAIYNCEFGYRECFCYQDANKYGLCAEFGENQIMKNGKTSNTGFKHISYNERFDTYTLVEPDKKSKTFKTLKSALERRKEIYNIQKEE